MSGKKPILLVMAAGMGNRYGGLKQIDPVGANGEVILDYSVFDAKQAGFESVIFIVSKAVEADFRKTIGRRMEGQLDISYAVQTLEDLPEGYSVPEGRTKPWGTAQAVYSARTLIDRPFAVLNADDYYGPEAFRLIFSQLERNAARPAKEQYAMVGYHLENTVTKHGHVARGVCQVGADGMLAGIQERTRIQCFPDGIKFSEDDGASWTPLDCNTVVSMNFWGFPADIIREIGDRFPAFLDNTLAADPMKGEFYVPVLVDELIRDGMASVQVLESTDKWYGVTYQADKQGVVDAIATMTKCGLYPETLWK